MKKDFYKVDVNSTKDEEIELLKNFCDLLEKGSYLFSFLNTEVRNWIISHIQDDFCPDLWSELKSAREENLKLFREALVKDSQIRYLKMNEEKKNREFEDLKKRNKELEDENYRLNAMVNIKQMEVESASVVIDRLKNKLTKIGGEIMEEPFIYT